MSSARRDIRPGRQELRLREMDQAVREGVDHSHLKLRQAQLYMTIRHGLALVGATTQRCLRKARCYHVHANHRIVYNAGSAVCVRVGEADLTILLTVWTLAPNALDYGD